MIDDKYVILKVKKGSLVDMTPEQHEQVDTQAVAQYAINSLPEDSTVLEMKIRITKNELLANPRITDWVADRIKGGFTVARKKLIEEKKQRSGAEVIPFPRRRR